MEWYCITQGINKHGTKYIVEQLGNKDHYRVELNYSYAGEYTSGCIALDIAHNTKIIRKTIR